MKEWIDKLKNIDFFFISPDIKKGLALAGIIPGYHLICSRYSNIIPVLRNQGVKIFCLEEKYPLLIDKFNNSGRILESKVVQKYIQKNSFGKPWIIYFKPSLKLDTVSKKFGYNTLANSYFLNRSFENKVNFNNLLRKNLKEGLIPSSVMSLKDCQFNKLSKTFGLPYVIQFGIGWAGKTTFIINKENDLKKLQIKYPLTLAVISKYIVGFTVLNNCCIYKDNIYISPPAIQLSNIEGLSTKEGETNGRQWPCSFIDNFQKSKIYDYSQVIGNLLKKSNYLGYFGLDFIVDKNYGKVYLSELNARLTASSSFYTRLEYSKKLIPLFVYHLAGFLKLDVKDIDYYNQSDLIKGSQVDIKDAIIAKKFDKFKTVGKFKNYNSQIKYLNNIYKPELLFNNEFYLIKSNNKDKISEELVRLETKNSVLSTPNQLNGWFKNLLNNNLQNS